MLKFAIVAFAVAAPFLLKSQTVELRLTGSAGHRDSICASDQHGRGRRVQGEQAVHTLGRARTQ